MIMGDAVVEGSRKFDHLGFFNLQRRRTVYGPLAFDLHRNATAAAGDEPATFGSAAEHRNRYTTVPTNLRFCRLVPNVMMCTAPLFACGGETIAKKF